MLIVLLLPDLPSSVSSGMICITYSIGKNRGTFAVFSENSEGLCGITSQFLLFDPKEKTAESCLIPSFFS